MILLALAFAAPALSIAPAKAAISVLHHDGAQGGASLMEASGAAAHDCDDSVPASPSHHATPDCLLCCCALAAPAVAPPVSRTAIRQALAESLVAFHGLNLAPPAPPPRG